MLLSVSSKQLGEMTDAELRAAFWQAQRDAFATINSDDVAFWAAVARKQAIVTEQTARRMARRAAL